MLFDRNVYRYDRTKGSRNTHCYNCNYFRVCWQHHIDGRRNSDDIVWVCHRCHVEEIHLKPEQAREKGFYNKLNNSYMKKSKKKKCKAHSWVFKPEQGQYVCIFCNKTTKEPKL